MRERFYRPPAQINAVVAQSVERFLGKEEVRQFKSAQQLQHKKKAFVSVKTFFFIFVLTV